MKNLEKIQNVATQSEISLIELDYRMYIDEYNNQNMNNYKPLTYFFEPMTIKIMEKIQSETHRVFGGDGMVLTSQILPALGLETNHHILDK